jgi:hypothetical protein
VPKEKVAQAVSELWHGERDNNETVTTRSATFPRSPGMCDAEETRSCDGVVHKDASGVWLVSERNDCNLKFTRPVDRKKVLDACPLVVMGNVNKAHKCHVECIIRKDGTISVTIATSNEPE